MTRSRIARTSRSDGPHRGRDSVAASFSAADCFTWRVFPRFGSMKDGRSVSRARGSRWGITVVCSAANRPAVSLAAHFPVVASVAASFKLFGIGIWQARVVGLLYTFSAFLLSISIARRLFNRSVAIVALGLLILVP